MKTHTFPNGFRIIYEKPKTNIPLTSILGFVKLGSIYEPSNLKGVSHFIEHMCFEGTKNNSLSTIINYYDSIGAYFNAYTEKEYTCYEIKCSDDHIKNSIHILSDLLLNSSFKKEDYTKEYKVVIEENIKQEDDMENILIEKSNSLLYEGSSYAYPVDTLQYHKNKKMKYEDVLQFYHHFYQPHNMVISIVSHISFSKIKTFLQNSYFMTKRNNHIPLQINPTLFILPQNEMKCKIYKKPNLNATYLCISFRTCSYENPDRYILHLFSEMIGGRFSSLLYSLLRTDNGLTYSCNSDVTFYKHSGDLSIYVIFNPTKLLKNGEKMGVLPLIIQLLNDLYKNGVSKEDFTIIKGYVKGQFLIESENSFDQCSYNGTNLLLYKDDFTSYNKIYPTHYHSIKKENVDAIIRKYFKKMNMTCCLLGSSLPSLSVFEKECNKFIG
jgi:predicted Zn-dependent peptidase